MALPGVATEHAHPQRRAVHLGGDAAAAELKVPGDALPHPEQKATRPQRLVEAAGPARLGDRADIGSRERSRRGEVRRVFSSRLRQVLHEVARERVRVASTGEADGRRFVVRDGERWEHAISCTRANRATSAWTILLVMALPRSPVSAFASRRSALQAKLDGPALFAAGQPRARNYRNNHHRFRASSHFLYFLGAPIPGAALLFARGTVQLFAPAPAADDALWHGPQPTFAELQAAHQLDAVRPLEELPGALRDAGGSVARVATLPTEDAASAEWLSSVLGRAIRPGTGHTIAEGTPDHALALAVIALRLRHDAAAIAQLRAGAEASTRAHLAGMRATRGARFEWEVAAAMTSELRRHHLDDAYSPIVTVHGEVLHNPTHDNPISAGDLLLADVGGETPEGWAADITRVWPVSGRFSPTQRAIYDAVLAAQEAAIARVKKGTRYRVVHETAGRTLVAALKDLGIFKGDVDGLYERGAAAIFFPHGVGHLLGLDVHDLEDLGDRAAYAPGRVRSTRFGDCYLRLDLDLEPGMAVTIEPGFYQVPALLADANLTGAVGADLDRDVLQKFADVRGIRIEDDVLCTEGEPSVLSRAAPKTTAAVEAAMAEAGDP